MTSRDTARHASDCNAFFGGPCNCPSARAAELEAENARLRSPGPLPQVVRFRCVRCKFVEPQPAYGAQASGVVCPGCGVPHVFAGGTYAEKPVSP